ncbi:MAG: hypothetical protein AAF311_01765 [Pseudomonadota bacterium]
MPDPQRRERIGATGDTFAELRVSQPALLIDNRVPVREQADVSIQQARERLTIELVRVERLEHMTFRTAPTD